MSRIFSSPEPKANQVSLYYICAPASVVRLSVVSPSTMLKNLLLRNRTANQSQMSCGASLGRENESLFAAFGHMAKMATKPIYGKTLQKSSSPIPRNVSAVTYMYLYCILSPLKMYIIEWDIDFQF